MAYYRLYFMDSFSGHIDHFREFDAEDDAAAIAQAGAWRETGPMELWSGNRKVRHWDSPVRPAPAGSAAPAP